MHTTDTAINIDGLDIVVSSGITILEAAQDHGIPIPTLCHARELAPIGACRICVVEVAGMKALAGACHTPVSDGMIIRTHSPKVIAARRATVELLLAAHTGDCVTDANAEHCLLHRLASELEVGPPRFRVRKTRRYPPEDSNPYVRRDLSKCIMCRKCVSACTEIAGKNLLDVGYRSFRSKIVYGRDEPLDSDRCKDCGICIDYCPTGALTPAAGLSAKQRQAHKTAIPEFSEPPGSRPRAGLLNALKDEKAKKGFLHRQAIHGIADEFGVAESTVFGVATFYSFLPLSPPGRHVIRICSNLPCHMKHSAVIVDAVRQAIGISPGETTADGRFSLELTNCIGACDAAPAMMVDSDIHGHLTAAAVDRILAQYD